MRVKVPTRIGPCYPRCTPTYGQGGSGSRAHRLVSGLLPSSIVPLVTNGLLNNLIAYWPGNEVAGNALDAHTNGLDLTDNNTVTSNPGQVYALARQYTRANAEYHTHADDALLRTGDVDFTLNAWCNKASSPAGAATIVGKYDTSLGNLREYMIFWEQSTNRFAFIVTQLGTYPSRTQVNATSLGAPANGTWYSIVAWHDSVANTINIQVNDGATDSAAHATGVFTGTAGFTIGAHSVAADLFDGRIAPTAFWKSAAGGGGVLTAEQRTALYNGGAGLTYAEFTL